MMSRPRLTTAEAAGFIAPRWPAPARVRCVSTTRVGGVSQGSYAGFNLADHVGDDPNAVSRNRARLARLLGLDTEPVWLTQRHGARVTDAAKSAQGTQADGSFTTRPNTVCVVLTADCLPVLLCDENAAWVAAVHAGWRGLSAGVLETAVRSANEPPEQLMAWIGPGISQQAYTVGRDFRDRFVCQRPQSVTAFRPCAGAWQADLATLARQALAGVGLTNIHEHGGCTFGDPARFFSYRRDGVTGRMASMIWIEPE